MNLPLRQLLRRLCACAVHGAWPEVPAAALTLLIEDVWVIDATGRIPTGRASASMAVAFATAPIPMSTAAPGASEVIPGEGGYLMPGLPPECTPRGGRRARERA